MELSLKPKIKYSRGSVYPRPKKPKKGQRRKWYLSIYVTVNGKKRRDTFPAGDTKQQAKIMLDKIRSDLFLYQCGAKNEIPPIQQRTFREAAEEFLSFRRQKLSTRGFKSEFEILARFILFMKNILRTDGLVSQLSDNHVYLYFRHLVDGGRAAGTLNRHLVPLRQFLDFCQFHGWTSTNPFANVEPLPVDKKDPRVLPLKTIMNFFNALPDPHRLFMQTIFFTISRFGEIQTLEWNQVDLERRVIVIYQSKVKRKKTKRKKVVPMIELLQNRLSEHCKTVPSDPDSFVFPHPYFENRPIGDIRKVLDSTSARLDINPPIRPKHMRSSALTHLSDLAESLVVKDAAGHASVRTTEQFYIQRDAEKLRPALRQLEQNLINSCKTATQ